MEKLNEETLLISQTKQEPTWDVFINENHIKLNNTNYLNYCLQKSAILLEENKNFKNKIPYSKSIFFTNLIHDLEDLLEVKYNSPQRFLIRAEISTLKRIAKCIYNDYHPNPEDINPEEDEIFYY